MAINKKLVHFKTFANFKSELDAGNILDTSICWIKDTQQIYTHGQYYNCSGNNIEDILSTTLNGYVESTETNEGLDLTQDDTILSAFGKLTKAIKDNELVESVVINKLKNSIGLNENLEFSITSGDKNITKAIERIDSTLGDINIILDTINGEVI